ncbi:MAG: DNA-binding protein [Oscillospiraceae bacterium]|nr:DNA-binding protein [Oscillospiraceae bacterium]
MEDLKLSEQYMLTVKEASTYFSIGEKKIRRMAENNDGGYAFFIGNRYLIIRPLMEQYFMKLAEKGATLDAEIDTGE